MQICDRTKPSVPRLFRNMARHTKELPVSDKKIKTTRSVMWIMTLITLRVSATFGETAIEEISFHKYKSG